MKKTFLYLIPAIAGFALVLIWSQRSEQMSNEVASADQEPVFASSEGAESEPSPSSEQDIAGEDAPSEADEEPVQGMHALRPIEDFPILTWADRVDREGQPAPRTPRGQHGRRILDDPVEREIRRDNPTPVQPFAAPRPAREDSLFAYTPHVRSAIEVEMSHRLFHEAASGEFHRMEVPLTEDRTVTVDMEKLLHRGPHTFSFWGKVEEHPDSQVILVYNEGTVAGGVSLYGVLDHETVNYEFVGMEEGLIAVQEVDSDTFLRKPCGVCGGHHPVADLHLDEFDTVEDDGLLDGEGAPEGDPSVDHIVDIVVGYGRDARIADGGTANIEGRIIASVDRMNISFENSLVDNTRLVLLALKEDPYYEFQQWGTHPDWGGLGEELAALQSATNGRLDTIAQLRFDLGADFSAFIVREHFGGHAGLAFRPGVYSVTARNYMSNSQLVFVHEVGHNYGLRHAYRDSSSANDTAVNAHNYAWRFQDVNGNNRRRTILSYGSWTRVMHFSNPDVIHPVNNARTGAENGFDGTNDPTVHSQLVDRGYDGTNSNLGARSAHYLVNNASTSANRLTRVGFGLTNPQAGEIVPIGETYWIEWVGGVHDDSVDIELWRDGGLLEVLAEDFPNTARTLEWTPSGLSSSEDYQIRIILNDGEEEVLSAPFTIEPDYPRVVSTFVAPLGVAEPGLNEVSVTFNRSIDTESFALGTDVTRFVGPDGEDLRGTLTDYIWSENDTVLTFSFAPLQDPGFYRIDFGPNLLDTRGFPMDQNGNEIPGEVDDGFGFTFRVGELDDGGPGARLALYENDFEEDAGGFTWQGIWDRGIPQQQGVGGPGSAYSGQRVLATNLTGNYAQNIDIYATSPVFSTENHEEIELEFQRWLGLTWAQQGNRQDRGRVEYRVGNNAWTEIWSNNGALDDGGWNQVTYSLPAEVENQSSVQIRFNLDTGNQSSLSYGWNIDDLVVSGVGIGPGFSPPPAPKVVGHMPAGAVISAPDSIWIDFDQPMNAGSFSLSDLSGISGADASFDVVDYAWTAENRLRLDLTGVNEDGTYTLTLGTGVQSVS
ncbi:MAG: hypothetical protein LAT58_13875, partial [Opitutales bacterium]|nr:hypothetical protein [Opitutales bacterium]